LKRNEELKLSIFKRLIVSYLAITVLILCSGIYTVMNLGEINRIIRGANSVDAQVIRIAEEIAQSVIIQTGSERKYLISRDRAFYNNFSEMNPYIVRKITELEVISDTEEGKAQAAEISALHERYRTLFEKAALSGSAVPKSYPAEKEKIISAIEKNCRRIAKGADAARSEKMKKSEEISYRISRTILFTESFAVVLVVLISFLITRSINSPIRLLREKTKLTARGEFGSPLAISSPPEIKELADSFNLMCERLRELDQMKVDFISHLSHELRTPLTAIKEASSMLTEGVFAGLPEKQAELFGIINEECERLISSVSRILELSRMEAGMADFAFEDADLVAIIRKTVAKLSPIADRKHIRLAYSPDGDIPCVSADPDKIGQVIENLIGNALKFTPKEGEVSIRLERNGTANSVEVFVTDTGCGIPRESLEEIFEKFKRVDDRKGTVRGTGLGLSIAKYIINAHGGNIWAESEPGRGSTFIFSLPLSRSSLQSAVAPPSA